MSANGLRNILTPGPHRKDLMRGGFTGFDGKETVESLKKSLAALDVRLSELRKIAGLSGKDKSFSRYIHIALNGSFRGSKEAADAILEGDKLALKRASLQKRLIELKGARPKWDVFLWQALKETCGRDVAESVRDRAIALSKEKPSEEGSKP